MSLSTTFEQLKKTLARSERAYEEGRARHAALAPYTSPAALLAAIDRGSTLGPEARDAVLFAVVQELRTNRNVLWQSILLLAFAPLLVRLRSHLRRPKCEDMDQRVLSAFLETARSVSSSTYVPRHLWLGVRARLHAERARDRRSRELAVFDDETYAPDLFGATSHQKAAAAEVLRVVEAEGGEDLREALLERHFAGASMKDYVDRAYASLGPRERARVCERLYRTELAVFRRLRARTARRERACEVAA
jgi:hypothetical protein